MTHRSGVYYVGITIYSNYMSETEHGIPDDARNFVAEDKHVTDAAEAEAMARASNEDRTKEAAAKRQADSAGTSAVGVGYSSMPDSPEYWGGEGKEDVQRHYEEQGDRARFEQSGHRIDAEQAEEKAGEKYRDKKTAERMEHDV